MNDMITLPPGADAPKVVIPNGACAYFNQQVVLAGSIDMTGR